MRTNKVLVIRRLTGAFTLVELLIVVIFIGTLAAIAIPQFGNASVSSRQGNLTMQLQLVQEQIAYYKLQHNNCNPPLLTKGWSVLTEYTDAGGNISPTADSTHPFGPYLLNAPANPLASPADVTVIAADTSHSPGWVYSEATGKIYATGTISTNYFNPIDGTDSTAPPY